MILSKPQAEAVYSAMCALNNVSGRVFATMSDQRVTEANGCVTVFEYLEGQWEPGERYASQSAFATAYGLNSDEWQSDVAAAAGGLTQTAIDR